MNWDKIRREYFETFSGEHPGEFKKGVKPIHVFAWLQEVMIKKPRSLSQNNALHLYYSLISSQLNNAGYVRDVQIGKEFVKVPYTPEYIKEFWRTVQMYLFKIKSTTKINTKQINEIIDIFSLHFGEKKIYVEFPNWQSFMNKLDTKRHLE
jgi:hypothetical protein